LYPRPDVLLFDEATSALDNTTEHALVQAIEGLKGSHTLLLIAHRLSTVRNCDTLFFMEKGKITASGSYDQLLAEKREFREMEKLA
jgi:ABC-type multidrug transport system fused ATPase/permease subunit